MTYVKYVRISLFLLFIVPLITLPFWFIPGIDNLPKFLSVFVSYSIVGLMFIGLLYIIIGILWRIIGVWSIKRIILTSVFIPLIFALIIIVPLSIGGEVKLGLPMGVITLFIGYTYVLIILGFYYFGRLLGYIEIE